MRESILQGFFNDVADFWRHRKGNEIPAAVEDVINFLWKDNRPHVVKTVKQEGGWFFVIHLPPGRSYAEFRSKLDYFQDSTGGAVMIEKQKKAIYLTVLTEELQSNYPYMFNWSQHESMFLPIPFGYSAAGLIVRDLCDAPNVLVAGVPGSGKSNFLHVLAVSILQSRDAHICIIDRKKLEFSYLENHALVVTKIDDCYKLLSRLNTHLDERLDELKKAGVVKFQNYSGNMPPIVLIIDELAELNDKDCQKKLNRIVRLGRAAGVCVVGATQRPSSTMFKEWGDSKAMFAATVCFHVRDSVNSRMLLDNDSAAIMPDIAGRAIYQWDTKLEIQAMYLPISKAKKIIKGLQGVNFDVIKPPKRLLPR